MLSQTTLAELWARGSPLSAVVKESLARAAAADRFEWVLRLPEEKVMQQVAELEKQASALSAEERGRQLPLLGMTFAVKDNIQVADTPMTNGCDYRDGTAPVSSKSAAVVQRLMHKGAVLIGKTNMDCAATGLVGVRSAYGACQNAFDRAFISGGSSSGSAVSVATGQVSFSLGTDTAGSGRVPAMFNNIVGLKASRGLLSAHGVFPACRSLDCVSIFATTVREAWAILRVAASAEGSDDPWDRPHKALTVGPRLPRTGPAKFRFGVPSAAFVDFNSFGEVSKDRAPLFAEAWAKSVAALEAAGGTKVEIDYLPFSQAAKLLYDGPWVAERFSAMQSMLETAPERIHPTVRAIIEPAGKHTAQAAFEAFYKLKELKQSADRVLAQAGVHVLVTPTAGMAYTIAEVQADPIALNSNLGRYTNHMNLLDLCGVAVPVCMAGDKYPFGVTISAHAGHDAFICDVAARVHLNAGLNVGVLSSKVVDVEAAASKSFEDAFLDGVETIQIVVSGAHMEGLPLCPQLTERGGIFVRKVRTKPIYKLLAFDGMKPPRPGVASGDAASTSGVPLEVEVWELPSASFGSFIQLVAQPLGIGWVELEDGSKLQGFRLIDTNADRCGSTSADGGAEAPEDVTQLGGWRKYLEEPPTKRARM